MYAVASLSGGGVVCSSKRFGLELGALDVFGDKDCLNAAIHWIDIGKTKPGQHEIDDEKFIDSLLTLKILGFKGLIIGSGFEGNYIILRKAKEIMPLFANSIAIFEQLESPKFFFETLKSLKIPFPKIFIPSDRFSGKGTDWIIKDLRSSGGLGIRKLSAKKLKTSEYVQKKLSGTVISLSFFADGKNFHPVGFSELISKKQDHLPFVFCGLEGPIELDDGICRDALRICKLLVNKFKLKGFNGIDLIVADGTVYFLELNPRLTSSFEVLQKSYDFCFIKEHIRLTNENSINKCFLHNCLPNKNNLISGFRIIYAEEDFTVDERIQNKIFDPNFVQNIPNNKYFFKKYEPVCSVFLSGQNLLDLKAALDNKVNYLYSKLSQLK